MPNKKPLPAHNAATQQKPTLRSPSKLISVDDTIDNIAKEALRIAREREERNKNAKERQ